MTLDSIRSSCDVFAGIWDLIPSFLGDKLSSCRGLQWDPPGHVGACNRFQKVRLEPLFFFIKTGNAEEVSEWKYDNIRLTNSYFHTDVWQESICNLQQQKNMYLDLNLFLVRQEVGKRKVLARGISLVVPHLPPVCHNSLAPLCSLLSTSQTKCYKSSMYHALGNMQY